MSIGESVERGAIGFAGCPADMGQDRPDAFVERAGIEEVFVYCGDAIGAMASWNPFVIAGSIFSLTQRHDFRLDHEIAAVDVE